jgi:AraC-like DNA-binding protein
MTERLIQIILLLAAGQSLFLALVFFSRYRQLYANRFLTGLLLLTGFILINLYWAETNPSYRNSEFNILLIGLTLLVGPLQYLYTSYLLRQLHSFRRKDGLHFLTLLPYLLYTVPVFFQTSVEIEQFQHNHTYNDVPWRFVLFNWNLVFVSLGYIAFTLWKLQRYQRGLRHVVSSLEKMRLQWLYNLTWLSAGAWIVFAVENMIFMFSDLPGYGFGVSSCLSGVFIYMLCYWGLIKSDWLLQPSVARSMQDLAEVEEEQHTEKSNAGMQRYQKSGLSVERAQQIHKHLLEVMGRDKPFLDSSLTLTGLADVLSVSTHNLSEVLNTQVQQTFFDFVNQYRVEEVKKQLLDPTKAEVKILALAFDAGFNSKTSFNTIFKKHTGYTPSDYREAMAK